MTDDSFQFGNYNSLSDWGIKCVSVEYFLPPKRERKITIPFKNGKYDLGAKNYDERILVLNCDWYRDVEEIPMHKIREIAYILSQKGKIYLSTEPDKYYTGEIYDSNEIIKQFNENLMSFSLTFVCEPFLTSEVKTESLNIGSNIIDYKGTAPTSPLLTIKNNGDDEITTITIQRLRRI